jgi:K319-like protein
MNKLVWFGIAFVVLSSMGRLTMAVMGLSISSFTNPVQSPPVAVAKVSPSSTVVRGTTVILNGLSSFATTSGAHIALYSWAQTSGPTVGLNGTTTATPTFTASSSPSTLTFSLTVTDSLGYVSSLGSVTVTVVPSYHN